LAERGVHENAESNDFFDYSTGSDWCENGLFVTTFPIKRDFRLSEVAKKAEDLRERGTKTDFSNEKLRIDDDQPIS